MMSAQSMPTIWNAEGAFSGTEYSSWLVIMSFHHASFTFRFSSTPKGP
jgi:hypothetical protein